MIHADNLITMGKISIFNSMESINKIIILVKYVQAIHH